MLVGEWDICGNLFGELGMLIYNVGGIYGLVVFRNIDVGFVGVCDD